MKMREERNIKTGVGFYKAGEPRIDKMPHRCLSCILAQSFSMDLFRYARVLREL